MHLHFPPTLTCACTCAHRLSFLSAIGVALAMGGGLWYGKARARMQEFAASSSSPGTKEGGKAEMLPLMPVTRCHMSCLNASSASSLAQTDLFLSLRAVVSTRWGRMWRRVGRPQLASRQGAPPNSPRQDGHDCGWCGRRYAFWILLRSLNRGHSWGREPSRSVLIARLRRTK